MTDRELLVEQLSFMAWVVRSWLDQQKANRTAEGLSTNGDTAFVCFDMPVHPRRAMFEAWETALLCAKSAIDEDHGQADKQRGERPDKQRP